MIGYRFFQLRFYFTTTYRIYIKMKNNYQKGQKFILDEWLLRYFDYYLEMSSTTLGLVVAMMRLDQAVKLVATG